MKKYILTLACLSMITVLIARNYDIKILPAKAKAFIETAFPDKNILYIEADRDLDDPLTYEVKFADGAEVEFDKSGRWYKIDCVRTPVPLMAIPEGIQNFISANAPQGSFVTEIERIRGGYEVELNNGADLHLTEAGQPLGKKRDIWD